MWVCWNIFARRMVHVKCNDTFWDFALAIQLGNGTHRSPIGPAWESPPGGRAATRETAWRSTQQGCSYSYWACLFQGESIIEYLWPAASCNIFEMVSAICSTFCGSLDYGLREKNSTLKPPTRSHRKLPIETFPNKSVERGDDRVDEIYEILQLRKLERLWPQDISQRVVCKRRLPQATRWFSSA